ncbi:MAG: hypothetical protein V4655_14460 [Bdellovibrionota bacterium]
MRSTLSAVGLFVFAALGLACDSLFPTQKDAPTGKRVDEVKKCNVFGTCLVIFDDGSTGLMTRPDVGDHGCPSLTTRSFQKCDAPSERRPERIDEKEEIYKDFPEK